MKTIQIVLLLFFVLCSKNSWATAQYGDQLVIAGDTVRIHSCPLEVYFSEKGERTFGDFDLDKQDGWCTALWRGYVATWKLENDSLFLVRIQTDYCGDHPKDISLQTEFASNKVFAQWVTDSIVCPQGELLQYKHMGYSSIYEGENSYLFQRGKLVDNRERKFLKEDDHSLFPGENFLRDLLREAILKSIDETERDSMDSNVFCSLMVSFNQDRKIDYMGFDEKRDPENLTEEIILRNAREALSRFPQLMKVNHKSYNPPRFELYFSGFCLKHPYDTDYGCGDEYRIDALRKPEYANWSMAQKWYNRQEKEDGIFIFVPQNKDKNGPFFPDWETAFSNEDKEYRITEIPLSEKDIRKTYVDVKTGDVWQSGTPYMRISCRECREKYQETRDKRYITFINHLVIRTNKETGETDGFIMMVIPDLSYLERNLDNPFQNFNFLERNNDDFNGIIQYYQLKGEWSNGWRYKEGKVYSLHLSNNEEKSTK